MMLGACSMANPVLRCIFAEPLIISRIAAPRFPVKFQLMLGTPLDPSAIWTRQKCAFYVLRFRTSPLVIFPLLLYDRLAQGPVTRRRFFLSPGSFPLSLRHYMLRRTLKMPKGFFGS